MKRKLKNIFLAGLAVVVPAGLTLYILFFIIGIMDGLLTIVPVQYQPDTLLHFHIPGLGAIVTVILIFICGLVASSYFGNKLVMIGEGFVEKIPFIRGVYQAIKRIADSIFMDKSGSFKKVVLVEYPRRGMYAVGFVTASPGSEIQCHLAETCMGVFLPLALTPTTGFYVVVPERDLIYLDMSVEEAFTMIISAGIARPHDRINGEGSPKPEATAS